MSKSLNEANDDVLQDVRIFVVDDEDLLAWSIETELKALGADVLRAASLREALERFPKFIPDVAITDLRLPDGNGIELLKKWHLDMPELPVILITAHGAVDSAVTALRYGAFDYLQKPFDMKNLVAAVKRAAEISQLRQKVSRLKGSEKPFTEIEIIGSESSVRKMRENLKKVAQSKVDTVLIMGESGTGKELAARAIHFWSDKAKNPFIEINCASIPETLLESELFGYERGAFTDARDRKLGLFEMAKDGTIFLDEIGELPLKLQAKLLRSLEYRRFKRLGGTKDIEFSARIVAATNRDLIQEVASKHFREDLYYRLDVLPIDIPPLRDRLGDLPELTEFFLNLLSKELEIPKPNISAQALDFLASHNWPGNIRELKNVLQRAMVLHQASTIEPQHLRLKKLPINPSSELIGQEGLGGNGFDPYHLPESGVSLEELEKSLLAQALEKAKNNRTRAAQLLGISRHTLRYRLEKYGLEQ